MPASGISRSAPLFLHAEPQKAIYFSKRMEKSSAAAAGGSTPPPPMHMDEFALEGKRPVKNPFVPIGALVTAGVLAAGLVSFRYGNAQLGQKLMRARVVAQGATVALMIGSAYYYGDQIKLFKKGSSS
ncbi:hypothetical protein E2562_031924 [Oryza meyeriana var. granulata]|uniref:HIG1 domain-containing protein n=1 Tax=Oryza meyeriana var. granulata TaxID=110450 RepID=A0A6G1DR03_9ORYZ|nr:hypothetical protein E2562_031924 [Oryza meyeriana var. granulata]